MAIPTRLLHWDDLKDRGIRYSKPHLYRLIKDQAFPRPVSVGGNRIGFVEAEIDAWLNAKIAARDGKAA